MKTQSSVSVRLQKSQSRVYYARGSQRIQCSEGQIWATQDGNLRDYVLVAGDCREFAAGSTLSVTALTNAAFCVTSKAAPSWRESALLRHIREFGANLSSVA